jgi:DNA-binding PadR family transcriptional regulator
VEPTGGEKSSLGARGEIFFRPGLDKHCVVMHSAAMLSRELVAASTVPLVLSVLTEGENYGYALIQRVRELSAGRIEWTEGMLYPVLHWMQKQGLIEAEWREAETGRKRKYYRLRPAGRRALATEQNQWMTVHQTLTKLWKTQPHLT